VKAGFCLLAGSLELAHAFRAGGPRSIHLGLVQIETLTGVESLGSKIVQMIGGHGLSGEGLRWLAFPRADRLAADESATDEQLASTSLEVGSNDAPVLSVADREDEVWEGVATWGRSGTQAW
jgi:hypothetical protein